MMKFIQILFCLIISLQSTIVTAQLQIIETGRPETMAYNNAQNVVGQRWGITFKYIAFDGVNFDRLDSITAVNQPTEDKLVAKMGVDWRTTFNKEVAEELSFQNNWRSKILAQENPIAVDKFVHFEQKKCNKQKYLAFVFEAKGSRYVITSKYKFKITEGKLKKKLVNRKPIHFEYPQNGITNR